MPVFQEFRMLQEVANIRIQVGVEQDRPLDAAERERAMNRLRSGKNITLRRGKDNRIVKPTRDLGLPSGAIFNLAAGGRKEIKGDETTVKLPATPKTGEGKEAG